MNRISFYLPLFILLSSALLAGCLAVPGITGVESGTPSSLSPQDNHLTPNQTATATFLPADLYPPDPANYQLALITSGLDHPVYLTDAADESGRLFIVEQTGTVRILVNGNLLPTPFLDLSSQVTNAGTEQGLLGLAFHPDFVRNGLFYVDYTDINGDTSIERYHVSADPNLADVSSGVVILHIDQPYTNHNGGDIAFGPDGYLYIGMGDGGSGGDPQNRAQDLNTLLGKLLRIDVNSGDSYGIPVGNPFVGRADAKPEIWSSGLRNPWRFSFDRLTGDLYIADVGQDKYEEIDFQPSGSLGGQNYGWSLVEGLHDFKGQAQAGFVAPIAEYSHSVGDCSITGGYVYRGSQLPGLQGIYFFGDFCTGNTWSLVKAEGSWVVHPFLQTGMQISSFGEDFRGELFIIDWTGSIYQIIAK